MSIRQMAVIAVGALVLFAIYFIYLAGGTDYPDTDTGEIDREQLFRTTETLLQESEAWPTELTADSVTVASSLEPYPVRTVRYAVEVDAPLEKAIEYVKRLNYSGPGRTDRPDPKTYRTAFQFVETIAGKDFPEVDDAVRFKVLQSMYKVEERAPGQVLIRKVEAVDPKGLMSTRMNNCCISRVFFRNYMYDEARETRATLSPLQP